jgi:hypothetical protein
MSPILLPAFSRRNLAGSKLILKMVHKKPETVFFSYLNGYETNLQDNLAHYSAH